MVVATSASGDLSIRSTANRLLADLPTDVLARLEPNMQTVSVRLGDVLYDPGGRLEHGYFPLNAVISLHYVLECGATASSAAIGREGMAGIALFLGGDTMASSAAVQIAGMAVRIDARSLRREFDRGESLQRRLLAYTLSLMHTVTQTAACNRHHSIDEQLCRWLLLTLDRVPLGELVVTQEQIAGALGVRRESVTEAAGRLQGIGGIRYRRGHITVLDRATLLLGACECYGVLRSEIKRMSQLNGSSRLQ
jgi:CRP-like cAMP-binding protein